MKIQRTLIVMPAAFMLILATPLMAATLRKSVYLTLAWGEAEGQVGHATPGKGEDDEGEWAGPTSFAVDVRGNVAIIDTVNERLQIISRRGQARQTIPFASSGMGVDDVDIDSLGRWYIIGETNTPSPSKKNLLLSFSLGKIPVKVLDLTSMGIQLPLDLELGVGRDFLVQDNHGFVTYRLDETGHILNQQTDDDRLLFLASKGTCKFEMKGKTVSIISSQGRKLATYPDTERSFSVIGLLPTQTLLVMFKTPEEKHFVLEGLSQSGKKVFSIPIQDQDTASLIFPTRLAGLRNVRVGADGAIYAIGRPDEDAFRIYRFEIVP